MRALHRRGLLPYGLALLCAAIVSCRTGEVEGPVSSRTAIRLVTGPEGGGFLPLGQQIAGALSQRMSGVEITAVHSAGAVANINAIQRGEAELAFTFADVAYMAFSGQLSRHSPPFTQLRGIAVLQVTPIALVARPGLSIRDPGALRGLRVGVGPEGSGTAVTASLILQAFGLAEDVRVETIGFQEAAERLLSGRLDAMFDNAINRSASLKRATDGGARFVPIEGPAADRVRRDYPFLTATLLSRELYGNSVHTIGVNGLLICRSNLDEGLVYELTKQLFLSLTLLGRGALRFMDVEQAPATSVPLHPGAARYYRERALSR